MSFLYNLTQNMKYNRKENIDSLHSVKNTPLFVFKKERMSAFASRGSLTLEAAIVVPIFFFAMLCLAYLLEMMAIQTTVRNALYSAGREVAKEAYVGTIVTVHELERKMTENIGADRLERSVISGDLDCDNTKYNWSTGVMDLSVQYQVELPFLMFRIISVTLEETLRVKGWTGDVAIIGGEWKADTVYVTDTGVVYHKDPACTYLDMSVQAVSKEGLEEIRNESGGKYHPCESCKDVQPDNMAVYITAYGTRYHTSLECKKIKRNIYAISIDEAYGLGGCSKCVK